MVFGKIAADFNVDPCALKSLMGYLIRNIQESDAVRAAFFANPDAVLKAGVEAWHKSGQALFAELLENRTEFAKETRAAIAEDVYKYVEPSTDASET